MKNPTFPGRMAAIALAAAAVSACGGSGSSGSFAAFPASPPSAGTPANPPAPAPAPAPVPQRTAGMVYAAPESVAADQGTVVRLKVLTPEGPQTVSTGAIASADAAKALAAAVKPGDLVDWLPGTTAADAVVATDVATTFNVILSKGNSTAAQFDMSRYGPEVTANAGVPGAMVAAGWVYNKTGSSITVGDGTVVRADQAGRPYNDPIKRYEETFAVSPTVKVYEVNTADYAKSAPSSFAAIPVTADYYHGTTSRQAAYLVFDKNHRNAADAKVVAIWYFTPKSTSDGKPAWDVPTLSPLLADKGNDPVSGQTYVSINATGVSAAPYTRSTEPFEIVKNTMYYIGDNEVASYVFKADMGTPNDPSDDKVIKVDAGWPNSGYQYWKNMELVGIDPRSVTDLWLTHAHADHYGTAVEELKMMDNAGKPIKLWGSKEDTIGITSDLKGNAWTIAGTLPASETVLRARTTDFYQYDKWYDFGNVQIMVIWSPGHTTGATNMLFKVKNPTDGKFYTFGYHGGYGFNGLERPTSANGWMRLAWQSGFSYMQNAFDVDFVAPQHTNHFPIVEVYQALKAYNRDPSNAARQLTMLDALRSKVFDAPVVNGQSIASEFSNQLEKRRSVVSYKSTDINTPTRRSLETSGPFKPGRENGVASVTATLMDGGRIIQGFVAPQNKNPALPLLATGIPTTLDPYVADPTGYYVQVAVKVNDAYQGFLPSNYSQFSPGMNATIVYQGGPVETTHANGWEYLRTQRLSSLQDAQTVLAKIAAGKSVTLGLTPASEIVVPTNVADTFR